MINSKSLNNINHFDFINSFPNEKLSLTKTLEGFFIVNTSNNEKVGPFTEIEITEIVNNLTFQVKGWPNIISEGLLVDNSNITLISENEAGVIETIEGTVTATHIDGASRTLISGDTIYQGEIINTEEDASIHISFFDGSDLSLGEAVIPTPYKDIPIMGDKITFGNLDVSFIVDEHLENYVSIHNWLIGIGFPKDKQNSLLKLGDTLL